MKRRQFLKKAAIATAATSIGVPYILPTGRLFAQTGSRVVNHVVFVLFAGGLRQQEAIEQLYLADKGFTTQGNIMNNMLLGSAPTNNLVYTPWNPIQTTPLAQQGTLFQEVLYENGPTGHYHGYNVAMTGNYVDEYLDIRKGPTMPTIFEYYRKHSNPSKSPLDAWWISKNLSQYAFLNYSQHPSYGAYYGANHIGSNTLFKGQRLEQLSTIDLYHQDDVSKMKMVREFLNNNFKGNANFNYGIQNSEEDRFKIKQFIKSMSDQIAAKTLDMPVPDNNYSLLSDDLRNIAVSWEILKEFRPELTVINTADMDVCHDDFTKYINFVHKADYGVGWLWQQIQSDPMLANDTIMICMPEHGRNLVPNELLDNNGLKAYDHTSDHNSRRMFTLINGPQGKVIQNQTIGSPNNPVGTAIDVIPTIAHILGFDNDIPSGMLPGRALTEAFV